MIIFSNTPPINFTASFFFPKAIDHMLFSVYSKPFTHFTYALKVQSFPSLNTQGGAYEARTEMRTNHYWLRINRNHVQKPKDKIKTAICNRDSGGTTFESCTPKQVMFLSKKRHVERQPVCTSSERWHVSS